MDLCEIIAMSREDRDAIMDSGIYNEVLGGYLIETMRVAGCDLEEINQAVRVLDSVLDDIGASEARQIYQSW